MPSTESKKLNPCPFAPSHLGPELSSSVSKCHGPGREQFAEEPSEDSERARKGEKQDREAGEEDGEEQKGEKPVPWEEKGH